MNAEDNATLDCVIVGAGPAGLAAAIYLGRYRRRVLVVDGGDSRAARIPATHNLPGFPDGIAGTVLLQRLREQTHASGALMVAGEVVSVSFADGIFEARTADRTFHARTVILATGTRDHSGDWGDLTDLTLRGRVRWCPICDGFEISDQNVAIIANDEHAIGHALFLRNYTRQLTLIVQSAAAAISDAAREQLAGFGIRLVTQTVIRVVGNDSGVRLELDGADALDFDTVYPMMGCENRSALARALGAECGDCQSLKVDDHQQTSVPGLYAVGDVVDAINQIIVGTGHAAIAATAVHNSLGLNLR